MFRTGAVKSDADPFEIGRVDVGGRPEALAVLLTGRADASEPAVATFLAFAAEHRLSLEHLWAARRGRRVVSAVLIVPGAGRTAVTFLSPLERKTQTALAVRTLGSALAALPGDRIALVQCLLEPGKSLKRRVLEAARFRFLAELMRMHRPVRRAEPPLPMAVDGRLCVETTWSEEKRPAFAEAIRASYDRTLDCPGLRGLREMDDILAGHMACGELEPGLWSVWHDRGRPVAVLLLTDSSQHDGHELVYLGVTPAYRGRGLGRWLVQAALHRVVRAGGEALHLAVDRQNVPALRLYRDLGFRTDERKTAMIYVPTAANEAGG